jgi:hypothetical protein
MLRRFYPAVLITTLLLATVPVVASSVPVVQGSIAGIELCPQSICGSAIFTGEFTGLVNGRLERGVFLGAITHDALPEEAGDSASITGGLWLIRTPRRTLSGYVMPAGTLTNYGDNTFTVNMTMVLLRGGVGMLHFSGLLNHTPFPPTIIGTVSQ